MKNKVFIGVDFGGTKILTGAITKEGKVIGEPVKLPTDGNDAAEKIFSRVTNSIRGVMDQIDPGTYDIAGIGLGVTGPIDIENGIILECPQLPTMNFYPLKKKIEELFTYPVHMNNDANCLIYGEAILGSGSGLNNIVGFTLGTGMGCAIVLDKKILNGSTGTAAELWPSPYRSGVIEDYVSGDGVTEIYKSISGKEETSLEIHNLALAGNKDALQTWNEFGAHLAVPIAWSINLIDPEVVIIGGSIASAYPFFKTSMEENLRKWICPVPAEKTKIVLAKLGGHAGFIGAACLMLDDN